MKNLCLVLNMIYHPKLLFLVFEQYGSVMSFDILHLMQKDCVDTDPKLETIILGAMANILSTPIFYESSGRATIDTDHAN